MKKIKKTIQEMGLSEQQILALKNSQTEEGLKLKQQFEEQLKTKRVFLTTEQSISNLEVQKNVNAAINNKAQDEINNRKKEELKLEETIKTEMESQAKIDQFDEQAAKDMNKEMIELTNN